MIFNGRIWTGDQGWHGYRHPSDPCNCNPTLRHDDHVHISVPELSRAGAGLAGRWHRLGGW